MRNSQFKMYFPIRNAQLEIRNSKDSPQASGIPGEFDVSFAGNLAPPRKPFARNRSLPVGDSGGPLRLELLVGQQWTDG
jgi:hypothetical protein